MEIRNVTGFLVTQKLVEREKMPIRRFVLRSNAFTNMNINQEYGILCEPREKNIA